MNQYPTGAAGVGYAQVETKQFTGTITGAGSPTPNALEQHEMMLVCLVDELGMLCGRACGVADRMFGSSPEAVSKNEATPSNPPTIRRLDDLVNAAHMRVAALRGYVERLERL